MTLSITDIQYHNALNYAECQYAECHYTDCCYAECRGAFFSVHGLNSQAYLKQPYRAK